MIQMTCLVQEERHPSAMGVGQSKEGFSMYGMFNKCVSPMGKRLLKLWFRRPIVNLAVLNDRQASPASSLRTISAAFTAALKKL